MTPARVPPQGVHGGCVAFLGRGDNGRAALPRRLDDDGQAISLQFQVKDILYRDYSMGPSTRNARA